MNKNYVVNEIKAQIVSLESEKTILALEGKNEYIRGFIYGLWIMNIIEDKEYKELNEERHLRYKNKIKEVL